MSEDGLTSTIQITNSEAKLDFKDGASISQRSSLNATIAVLQSLKFSGSSFLRDFPSGNTGTCFLKDPTQVRQMGPFTTPSRVV